MKIKVENGLEIIPVETNKSQMIVLELIGWMDKVNGPIFERSMNFVIDDKKYNKIIFDFSRLDYINSGGVKIFGIILKKINRSGGKMILINTSEKVLSVFDEMGFKNFFEFAQDRDEALRNLNIN